MWTGVLVRYRANRKPVIGAWSGEDFSLLHFRVISSARGGKQGVQGFTVRWQNTSATGPEVHTHRAPNKEWPLGTNQQLRSTHVYLNPIRNLQWELRSVRESYEQFGVSVNYLISSLAPARSWEQVDLETKTIPVMSRRESLGTSTGITHVGKTKQHFLSFTVFPPRIEINSVPPCKNYLWLHKQFSSTVF